MEKYNEVWKNEIYKDVIIRRREELHSTAIGGAVCIIITIFIISFMASVVTTVKQLAALVVFSCLTIGEFLFFAGWYVWREDFIRKKEEWLNKLFEVE